jgi:hypothetical protein
VLVEARALDLVLLERLLCFLRDRQHNCVYPQTL